LISFRLALLPVRFPVFIRLLAARRQFSRSRNTIFAMIFEFSVHGGRARKLCRHSSGNGNTNRSGRKHPRCRRHRRRFDKTVTIPCIFRCYRDSTIDSHCTQPKVVTSRCILLHALRHAMTEFRKKKPSVHRRMDRNLVRQFYRVCIRM